MPWSSNHNARHNNASSSLFATSVTNEEETTLRHWTFNVSRPFVSWYYPPYALQAFEWVIRDVSKLKEFVECREVLEGREGATAAQNDDFEILKESPLMGDGKFKLEIGMDDVSQTFGPVQMVFHAACTPLATENNPSTEDKLKVQSLSLYITSLMVDFPHTFETSASMMTAIKCQDDRVGERGARAEWIWEFWQDRWKFRLDSEVWGLLALLYVGS